MAAKFLLLLSMLFLKLLIFSDAQSVGVCNGMVAKNLPSKQAVVDLYKNNRITRMRIYGPDPDTLRALGGTNIELILDVPNNQLQSLSGGAKNWVQNNILNYPSVNFRYISVGNEVDPNTDSKVFTSFVLPAMRNVQQALRDAGRTQIKVSTATYTGLLKTTYPPSEGVFRDNVIPFIQPIITFLAENNSPMLANIYPYFAYKGDPNSIKLPYALFTKSGIEFNDKGLDYSNLFDAMYDAHYAAQARLGGANVPIVVSESGWPSAEGFEATIDNAGAYYRNLIAHVKSTKGTPKRQGPIETYLFAMFDENDKTGDPLEKHFGVFRPDTTPKYGLSF